MTPHETTIETAYAAGVTRIASLELTEGEPDGQTIDWSLGPITAMNRRPRPGDKDIYEIWPTGLHTIIRVEAGTPVRFTVLPDTPQTPPAPRHPDTPHPQTTTHQQPPATAPRPPAPWLTQNPPANHTNYPPPTIPPYPQP
ncbi:hypothetical protein [Streptomyces sp. NPDC001948]